MTIPCTESDTYFDQLFATHRHRVYGFCLRMTRNPQDAEDLTQQVFLRLHLHLPRIQDHGSLPVWLKQVAYTTFIGHLRRIRSRKPHDSLEAMLEDNPAALPAERLATRHDAIFQISLKQALAKLGPKQRASFILKYCYGYEHQEIARMLKCVPGTSKSQCFKACRTVSALLGYKPTRQATSL